MNDHNHVTQNEILAFKTDNMNPQDMEKFLEHICSCDYCSDQFANCMEDELITAPIDMKENILKAVKRPDVVLSVKAKEMSKRMQLFIYSLKVGTAMVGALFILMLTANFNGILTSAGDDFKNLTSVIPINRESTSSLSSSFRENMDHINNNIMNFSNSKNNKEDLNNDKKER